MYSDSVFYLVSCVVNVVDLLIHSLNKDQRLIWNGPGYLIPQTGENAARFSESAGLGSDIRYEEIHSFLSNLSFVFDTLIGRIGYTRSTYLGT